MRRPIPPFLTYGQDPTALSSDHASPAQTAEHEDRATFAEAAVAAAEAVAAAAAAEVAGEAARTAQAAVDVACAAAAKAAARAQQVAAEAAAVVAASVAVQHDGSGAHRTVGTGKPTSASPASGIEATRLQGAAEAAAQSAQAQRVARRVVVVAEAASTAARDAAEVVAAQLHKDAAAAANDVASGPLVDDDKMDAPAGDLDGRPALLDRPSVSDVAVAQQNALQSLAMSDGLAAALLTSAADAIIGMDRHCLVSVWNSGAESLFGWTAEQMLGTSLDVLIPRGRQDEMARVHRAAAGESESAAFETERVHRSGRIVPVSCRLSPLWNDAGDVVGACAVVRDISRETGLRQELEIARQAAEDRFEQSVVAQATLSPHGVLLQVNEALCRMSGYTRKELLGRPVTELMTEPDEEVGATDSGRIAICDPGRAKRPQMLKHAAGRVIETRISLSPVRGDAGALERLEVVIEDVSDAAAAHRELQLNEERWRSLASHSSEVALLCTADAQLLFATDSALAVFGHAAEDLLSADGWGFVHPDDVVRVKALWETAAAESPGTTSTFELRILHADGGWRWAEETLTNQLQDPAVQAMVVNLVDISERKTAEAVLEELAGVDTLTGLVTRAPLMAALDTAFAADQAGTTAVAVVDVTRLKLINDTYGHRVGDEVLARVAARLSQAVDGQGLVARIGGDRFAAVVSDVTEISEMAELAAALLDAVEEPLQVDAHSLSLTATVGAAVGAAVDSGALLASAESALTTAREGLTGPVHVVRSDVASAAVSRARLIEDLRRGLDNDELVVHFQPVIALSEGRAVAAEALVRWQHPERGLLTPGDFIDAAEESGLIIELGQVVLREACRAAARWAKVGGKRSTFHVAVNLSAKQLTRGGIVDVVRQALTDSGARPANLMLEVTESAVMSDVDAAVHTLQELRALGVAIAVDDFGTGYSSLTYLKKFPVTTLKIDRSFVSGLGANGDDAAIVTSVINLARAMGLDCIAEGVETEEQRLVLQALGCSLGQGFLWSPGLDATAFETWLGVAAPRGQATTGTPAVAHQAAQLPQPLPARHLPTQPAVLSRVAELTAQGASLTTIAAALNTDQHVTPDGKRWTSRTVAQLLAKGPLH